MKIFNLGVQKPGFLPKISVMMPKFW